MLIQQLVETASYLANYFGIIHFIVIIQISLFKDKRLLCRHGSYMFLIVSSHSKLKFIVLNEVTLLVSQTIKGTNIIVNPVNNGL